MFVCCECCVLSGRCLCDELITCPEESYRLCCVVVCDPETSRMRRPWPALGCSATKKNSSNYLQTFDKLWFPSSGILEDGTDRSLKMGPISWPETSTRFTSIRCVISQKSAGLFCIAAGAWSWASLQRSLFATVHVPAGIRQWTKCHSLHRAEPSSTTPARNRAWAVRKPRPEPWTHQSDLM